MAKKKMTPYEEWFSNLTGRQTNEFLRAVNAKTPKDQIEFKNKFGEQYYDRLWEEAEAHEKKYGFWPTYEMCEIEWEDPVLDVYGKGNTADDWAEDRKNKK